MNDIDDDLLANDDDLFLNDDFNKINEDSRLLDSKLMDDSKLMNDSKLLDQVDPNDIQLIANDVLPSDRSSEY